MKKTAYIAGLAALMGLNSVGCKTSPKQLAWWQKDAPAESTAVAHTAPPLPSEIAKQSAASASPAQVAGGEAAPFAPGQTDGTKLAGLTAAGSVPAAPTSYPTTNAPAFSPKEATEAVRQVAGAASTEPPVKSGSLGNIALPYDPQKAPAPSTSNVASTTMPTPDRYAPYEPANPGGTNFLATSLGQPPASQNPQTAADLTGGATTTPGYQPQRYAPVNVASGIGGGSRYEQAALDAGSAGVAPSTGGYPASSPTQQASATGGSTAVASVAQPYRPGGTSTYPSTLVPARTQVNVATRPDSQTPPGSNFSGTGATSTTPVAPATPAISPSASRYW